MASHDADIFRFPRYDQALEDSLCRQPREEISAIQVKRLRPVLQYCWDNMPFYREMWSAAGVHPNDAKSVADLQHFPTWDKEVQRKEIAENPPFGRFYVSTDVRNRGGFVVSSGGTTGDFRYFPVLGDDLPGLKDILARTAEFAGVTSADTMQICSHFSALAAPWCGTWAGERVGVTLVPTGSGRSMATVNQVKTLARLGVTVLRSQLTYAERLLTVAEEEGLNPRELPLRIILSGGEPYSAERRKRVEEGWGAKVYDFFGSSDTFAWSSIDCEYSRSVYGAAGMHVWEDAIIVEILDENQQPCPDGEYGELTFTSLNWMNSPRIRFRTGDLAAKYTEQCECGRTLARMSPIRGRVDKSVRIKGRTLYPQAIEDAVLKADATIREFYAVATNGSGDDQLDIYIEWAQNDDGSVARKFAQVIEHTLGLTPSVKLVPPGETMELTGSNGSKIKPVRLMDERTTTVQ